MIVTAIKTDAIRANQLALTDLIDKHDHHLENQSVLAVSSKVVSLCEGAVLPVNGIDKLDLVRQEADMYLPPNNPGEDYNLTIKNNTLAGSAGIDLSNADGQYVLWPRDPQSSANKLRQHLSQRFEKVGVVITDSFSQPLRRGAIGGYLAFSGFKPLTDYRGEPDIFGRTLQSARSNVVGGLAAAATLAMGEGNEQTPLALITDFSAVQFTGADLTDEELAEASVPFEEDFFTQILNSANWKQGGRNGLE